jgi:cyclic dehypoxanthinyl futalosine synthase
VWNRIEDKVSRGERLTPEEGVHLLTEAPLVELGALANDVRLRRCDPRIVTYVIDTNPNYTNWCTVDCHFCAFYRKTGKPAADGYTHDVEGVMAMMENARRFGATTVLLQGGLNPEIPWSFYTSIVREARLRYPEITPHFFSAPEIHQMAEVSGLDLRGVLEALYAAASARCPAAARRSSRRACASASRSRRAVPKPGSTCTAMRTRSACAPRPR